MFRDFGGSPDKYTSTEIVQQLSDTKRSVDGRQDEYLNSTSLMFQGILNPNEVPTELSFLEGVEAIGDQSVNTSSNSDQPIHDFDQLADVLRQTIA